MSHRGTRSVAGGRRNTPPGRGAFLHRLLHPYYPRRGRSARPGSLERQARVGCDPLSSRSRTLRSPYKSIREYDVDTIQGDDGRQAQWEERERAAAAATRDIADVPAVEVITTAAVHLMSAAAVKVGLADDPEAQTDLD